MRAAALLLAILIEACGGAPKLVQRGGECFQATDCAAGLVCIADKDRRSTCDSDLSGVQRTEDAAAPRPDASPDSGEAGATDAATDGSPDAPATDAAADAMDAASD